MPSEHVEILRRADAAFQRGDLTAALADMDEGITATRVAPLPDVKTYEGHEGMRQILLDWIEGFDEFAMTSQEFIEVSDSQVLVRIRQVARGAQSGVPIEADFWFLYEFRNRKAVRLEVYGSKQQALESAGRSQ